MSSSAERSIRCERRRRSFRMTPLASAFASGADCAKLPPTATPPRRAHPESAQTRTGANASERACTHAPTTADASAASGAAASAQPADPLAAAIAGSWRDPKNVARDRYRHPRETLAVFDWNRSEH